MGDGGENDTRRKLTENPFSGDFNQLPEGAGNTADRLRNNEQFDSRYNQVADRGAQPQDGNPLFEDAYQRQEVPRGMDRRPEIPQHIERYLDPNGNNIINVYNIRANVVEIGNQRDAGRPYVDPAVYHQGNWEQSPRVRISQDRYQGPRDMYGDYYQQATRNPRGQYEAASRYAPVSYEPQVDYRRDRVDAGPGTYSADRTRTTVGGRPAWSTPPYVPDDYGYSRSSSENARMWADTIIGGATAILGITHGNGRGGWNSYDPRYASGGRYGGYDPRYGGYDPRYGGYDPRYGGYDYGGGRNPQIYIESRGGRVPNVRSDSDRVYAGPGVYSADRTRTRVGNGGYDGGYDQGSEARLWADTLIGGAVSILGITEGGRNNGGDRRNYYSQAARQQQQYGRGPAFDARYAEQARRAYRNW